MSRSHVNEGANGVTLRDLRVCLAHLYDFPFLAKHPLAEQFGEAFQRGVAPGPQLSNLLIELVEGLRPLQRDETASRAWRRYQALLLRYVDGADTAEVARRLSISQSEYYRLLQEALTGLVSLTYARRQRDARWADALSPTPIGAKASALVTGVPRPFVGRGQELHALVQQFEEFAESPGSRAVLVVGPSGVGKTRLVMEFGRLVRERGASFIYGRYLRDGYVPYDAWTEALGSVVDQLSEGAKAETVQRYPELADLFPKLKMAWSMPAARMLDRSDRRQRLYDGVVFLLKAAATTHPLALAVDDLHWAPAASLFGHVARRLRGSRVFVIAAANDDERESPAYMHQEVSDLVAGRDLQVLRLAPLSREVTEGLVVSLAGAELGQRIKSAVYEMSMGNPLFAEELVRSFQETDVMPSSRPSADGEHGTLRIPNSLKALLTQRVQRVAAPTRELLLWASVLGERASGTLLQQVTGLSEEALLAALEEAIAARLLVDDSSSSEEVYRFNEPLIREVLYEQISGPARRSMHLKVCDAIRSLYDDTEQHIGALARHYAGASKLLEGAAYALQAGAKAEAVFAYGRAIAWYEMALGLYQESGEQRRQQAEVCARLGRVYCQSVIDSAKGVELLRRALRIYEELGERRELASAHAELGRVLLSGGDVRTIDLGLALRHLNTAHSLLSTLPPTIDLASTCLGAAMAHARLIDLPESIRWGERALALGERLRRPEVIAEANVVLGGHLAAAGEVARGLALLEQGWNIATAEALAGEADLCRHGGTWLTGISLKNPRDGLAWAERTPDYHTHWSSFVVCSHLVAIHALRADFVSAEAALTDLRNRLANSNQPGFGHFPSNPGLLLFRLGRWNEAQAVLEEGLAWGKAHRHYLSALPTAAVLGELYLNRREYSRAEEVLTWAYDIARRGGSQLNLLRLIPRLSTTYLALGQYSRADEVLEVGRPIADGLSAFGGAAAEMWLADALFQAARGSPEQGEAQYRRAMQLNEKHELAWDSAYARFAWAGALSSFDDTQLASRGAAMVEEAVAQWDGMGAGKLANQVLRLAPEELRRRVRGARPSIRLAKG